MCQNTRVAESLVVVTGAAAMEVAWEAGMGGCSVVSTAVGWVVGVTAVVRGAAETAVAAMGAVQVAVATVEAMVGFRNVLRNLYNLFRARTFEGSHI